MILRHLVGSDKHDGFYVDVGAYHPVLFSNTYFFYLHGWRGLNIEARPGSRQLFETARPRDINLEMGVSRNVGELTYYVVGEDSTMNSFSREFLEEIDMLKEVKREVPVPVLPLADVFRKYLPANQPIDFLTVDAEGHDLEVLESNDWERFRPSFVVSEDTATVADESEIVRVMRSHDYEVCAQNTIILDKITEYFFVDRSVLTASLAK